MTRMILEIKNNKDIMLIKELADRLKIKYEIQNPGNTEILEKDKLKFYGLIKKGVDVSNYGDPSTWQKNVRKDRNQIHLP